VGAMIVDEVGEMGELRGHHPALGLEVLRTD
jgi:hypothetical protein